MHVFSFPPVYPSLVVGSVADAASLRGAKHLACDWLEWRVDGLLREMSVEELEAQSAPCPVLLTVRTQEEGGLYAFADVDERAALALRLMPRAVALDWELAHLAAVPQLLAAAHQAGVAVIASAHDFEKTPRLEELREKEIMARELGADVVKFAFRVQRAEDLLVGVELLRGASGPMAVMGMGELGPVSRLLYAQHGSCLVYGYLGGNPTAPGQWSVDSFRAALSQLSPCC